MMIEKLENDGRTDDGDLAERAATHVPSLSAGDSYPQYTASEQVVDRKSVV